MGSVAEADALLLREGLAAHGTAEIWALDVSAGTRTWCRATTRRLIGDPNEEIPGIFVLVRSEKVTRQQQ